MHRTMQDWKPIENTQGWVNNFHLMCSKDNTLYPKYFREYFDTPRNYDVNGSRKYGILLIKYYNRVGKMSPRFRRFLEIRIRTVKNPQIKRCQSVDPATQKIEQAQIQPMSPLGFNNKDAVTEKKLQSDSKLMQIKKKLKELKSVFHPIDPDLYSVF